MKCKVEVKLCEMGKGCKIGNGHLPLSLSLLLEKMDFPLFKMSSSSKMTGIQDVFKTFILQRMCLRI